MELFHTPDTMPDAPNKGSNTRSKPAGLGNQVRELKELGLLPDFDDDLLPTPSAVDGSGGSMQQSMDSLRAGKRQRHLTDLPRLLELGAEDVPLLRTPQAQVTEPKPGIKLEGRSPSDPQVGLADQVLADFHGDLLPTPVVNDMGDGRTPGQWDQWTARMRERHGNGNGHGRSLSVEVQREMGETSTEANLLPTPMARDHHSPSPAEALRHSPGLPSIGDLLPTPQATDHMCGTTTLQGRIDSNRQVMLPHVVRELDERVKLLPTPTTSDSRGASCGGAHDESVRVPRLAAAVEVDLPAELAAKELKLLPTPTTLDHVEKRTTHAGGNPTLQGAICGTNPVDAERLGIKDEVPLLPTPKAHDGVFGTPRTTGRPIEKSTHLGTIVSLMGLPGDDAAPLLPTPQAFDSVDFVRSPEQLAEVRSRTGRSPRGNGNLRETVVNELPLLPTPRAQEPGTTSDGYGDCLNKVVLGVEDGTVGGSRNSGAAMVALPLLPTPKAADSGATDSPGERSRRTPSLGAISVYYDTTSEPLFTTPQARDWKGIPGDRFQPSGNLCREVAALLEEEPPTVDHHGEEQYVLFSLPGEQPPPAPEPVASLDDGSPLLPTPNVGAREVRNSPGEMARSQPALGAVVADLAENGEGSCFHGGDLFPTPNAENGRGNRTPEGVARRLTAGDKQVSLEDVVVLLPEDDDLLPTPTTGYSGRDPEKWRRERKPSTVGNERKITDLQVALVELVVEGGGDLFPTPVAKESGLSPEQFDEWVERLKSKGYNGNGHGRSLAVEVQRLGRWDDPLLPTPVVTDSVGARNSTAWRSDPESTARIGDTLTDAMWKLAAERGEMELPSGPSQRRFIDPLLPTPVAADGNGHMQRPDADVGNNGRSVSLGDVVSRLPECEGPLFRTPNVSDGNGGGSHPATRGGHQLKLSDQVIGLVSDGALLPTPQTVNRSSRRAMLGISDPEGNRRHWTGPGLEQVLEMLDGSLPREFLSKDEIPGSYRNDLLDPMMNYVLPIQTEKETLLPTPKSHQRGDCPSEHRRENPDLAAATYHFPAGRWGKYGPAVERWEKLTRPAPNPTEPNKNGNPRLTARFSEWLMGWPEGWVTDPEIGIARTGQLRLIGNGVVPQQAATALAILIGRLKEEGTQ